MLPEHSPSLKIDPKSRIFPFTVKQTKLDLKIQDTPDRLSLIINKTTIIINIVFHTKTYFKTSDVSYLDHYLARSGSIDSSLD